NKGGDVLIKIAAKMPDVMFLGVEGGYDSQIKQDLKNIIYVRNNAKIEEYFHWSMDRIACPSAPTIQYHAKSFKPDIVTGQKKNAIVEQGEIPSMCKGWEALSDKELNEKWQQSAKNPHLSNKKVKDPCQAEYDRYWDSSCLASKEWKEQVEPQGQLVSALNTIGGFCDPDEGNAVITRRIGDKTYVIHGDKIEWYHGEAPRLRKDDSGNLYVVKGQEEELADTDDITNEYDLYRRLESGQLHLSEFRELLNEPGLSQRSIESEEIKNRARKKIIELAQRKNLNEDDLRRIRQNGIFEKQAKQHYIDPTSSFVDSVRCGCLPGAIGYLEQWKTISEAVMKCSQAVLVNKKASEGMCRAVFTQYACDFVWDGIRCFTRKYGGGEGTSLDLNEKSPGSVLRALTGAGNDISTAIRGRYGGTNMYKVMFTEKRLIRSACYYSFTGDYLTDLENMMVQTTKVSIASQGFIYPATRRFIASNPVSQPKAGIATHVYHIGAGIIGGGVVGTQSTKGTNYWLELVCSNDASCNSAEGFEGGRCDCYGKPEPKTIPITQAMRPGTGVLGPGEIHDDNIYLRISENANIDPYGGVENSQFRYDKVRLRWTWTDNNGQPQSSQVLVPLSQEGPGYPPNCKFDLLKGYFHCETQENKFGKIEFVSQPLPDYFKKDDQEISEYFVGDTFSVSPFEIKFTLPENVDVQSKHHKKRFTFVFSQGKGPSGYTPARIGVELKPGVNKIPFDHEALRNFPNILITPSKFAGGADTPVTTNQDPRAVKAYYTNPVEARGTTSKDYEIVLTKVGDRIEYKIFEIRDRQNPARNIEINLNSPEEVFQTSHKLVFARPEIAVEIDLDKLSDFANTYSIEVNARTPDNRQIECARGVKWEGKVIVENLDNVDGNDVVLSKAAESNPFEFTVYCRSRTPQDAARESRLEQSRIAMTQQPSSSAPPPETIEANAKIKDGVSALVLREYLPENILETITLEIVPKMDYSQQSSDDISLSANTSVAIRGEIGSYYLIEFINNGKKDWGYTKKENLVRTS
ncbi:MAG: hypothetical protein QW331_03440, partial [Candidatus Woesearchaeota archaeon]